MFSRRLQVLICALWLIPGLTGAAELTNVIDAADGDDLYDFIARVMYRRVQRGAKITREYSCDPSTRAYDLTTCPGAGPAGELLEVKELRYEHVIQEIVPELRFGIWHDLELLVEMPIVLEKHQTVEFAGNDGDPTKPVITPENSSIAPRLSDVDDPENLFDVPTNLPTRAGFGDMLFMLRFSPLSQERDPQRGEWTLELGYRAPTGQVARFGNEGVGRGVHEVIMGTSLSRRFKYVDPYMSLKGFLVFPSKDTLFKDYGSSQNLIAPGHRARFELGSEIIPYHDPKKHIRFFVDLRLGATYHAEGRDYSELFDAFASASKTCDPNGQDGASNCPTYTENSDIMIAGQFTDGITDVEEYLTLGGRFGLGAYLSEYVRFEFNLNLEHDTEHFITNADIGKDLDNSGLVEGKGDPKYSAAEQNPTYVPAYDTVGRRIRVEETMVFTLNVGLSGIF
ncbi:hypothetical protein KKF91_00760 [Myxococcota bacterium]|nr:hypothetical protein [Myxococcota bacterium]